MIKKSTIPTILGVLILIFGVVAGVFGVAQTKIFKSGASAGSAPKDIRVSNITDSSVTISWTTDKETQGFVSWGASANDLSKVVNEDLNNQKYFNHSLSLTGLSASTNYFYKINSDGNDFDNGGIPWQFTTGVALGVSKNSILVSGNVISASGTPEKRSIVYANINNYLLSTQTSDTGNYVFQIGSTRTSDLQSYAALDLSKTLIQISVVAAPDGVASAQIFPQSANPVPAIVIGQVYDFRSSPANNQGGSPSAKLSLPQDAPAQSKFNIASPSATPKPTSVILESLQEGETITTNKPQFFGKGPGGETITVTVHSQNPISATVQIPKNGSWSYSVPTNLDPGSHTITVSWVDASGITRLLTRNFVVKAGEIPAFTASQSGTLASPTPASSVSATPKVTLKPSPTATAMPVPVTGDLTPTLLLSIMGLAVLAFSFVVWKVAEI